MSYGTVIFDFDGTLLYTIDDLADAVNFAMEKYGCPTHDSPTIQGFVGNGVRKLVERSTPGGTENPDFDGIFDAFRTYYSAHCLDKTRPYDGIMPMLSELKRQGRRLAIVTNKYQTAAEELRKRYFDSVIPIIIGDYEGRAIKPAPDGVFAALKLLGAEKNDAVYVGDTEVDMKTAENSGLDFVCAGWGYRTAQQIAELGVKRVAASPAQLLEMI